jgi:hypothetical protein
MKLFLAVLLFVISAQICAQDVIYLVNGERYEGKVTEVHEMRVRAELRTEVRDFSKSEILLIHYADGKRVMYSRPQENLLYGKALPGTELKSENLFSINTLGLCNGDITLVYEKPFLYKLFSIGGMASWNFNPHTTFLNPFIQPLANSSIRFGGGAFINLYPYKRGKEFSPFYGIMVRYISFRFDQVRQDNGTGGTTKFIPVTGEQLSFLFTSGMHWQLNPKFFMQGLTGLGFFVPGGPYKQEYSRISGNDLPFLLKLYLAINAGFIF